MNVDRLTGRIFQSINNNISFVIVYVITAQVVLFVWKLLLAVVVVIPPQCVHGFRRERERQEIHLYMMVMDMNILCNKLAAPWRKLLLDLWVSQRPMTTNWMGSWLQKAELSGFHLDWAHLIKVLVESEPSTNQEDGKLSFMPTFHHFPLYLQKQLLIFVHHHKCRIHINQLSELVNFLDCHNYDDEWIQLVVHLLKKYLAPTKQDTLRLVSSKSFKESFETQSSSSVWNNSLWRPKPVGEGKAVNQQKRNRDSPELFMQDEIVMQQAKKRKLHPADKDIEVGKEADFEMTEPTSSSMTSIIAEKLHCGETDSHNNNNEIYVELPDSLQSALREIYELWHGRDVHGDSGAQLAALIHSTQSQMDEVCRFLKLEQIPEANITNVIENIVKADFSSAHCAQLLKHLMLRRVNGLEQNASRVLLGGMTILAKNVSRQAIEGIFIPAMSEPQFGMAQAELICRLIKDSLPQASRLLLFRLFLEKNCRWTDAHILVLQTLLDAKMDLAGATVIISLINQIDGNSQDLANSLRFAKFLLALINNYGKQFLGKHAGHLTQVVESNKTFLKKSLHAAVVKL